MFIPRMPKFLSELKPGDWFKIIGFIVISTMAYGDVQSSLKSNAKATEAANSRIERLESTVAEAVEKQAETNAKIAETLGQMNRVLGAIEASNQQMDKRLDRIENKL